jgi:hypothetical protein
MRMGEILLMPQLKFKVKKILFPADSNTMKKIDPLVWQ